MNVALIPFFPFLVFMAFVSVSVLLDDSMPREERVSVLLIFSVTTFAYFQGLFS